MTIRFVETDIRAVIRALGALMPPLGGPVDDWTLQRRVIPGTRPDGGETCLFTGTDLGVHEPDLSVHEPDPGVHEVRSSCSRCTDLGVHDGPLYAGRASAGPRSVPGMASDHGPGCPGPITGNPNGELDGLVPDHTLVAHLDPQRIADHDRYIRSSGRCCQAVTSATTASVTVLITSGAIAIWYNSSRWPWISRTVRPRA